MELANISCPRPGSRYFVKGKVQKLLEVKFY